MTLYPPMKISARLLPAVKIDTSWVSIEFEHRRTPDGRVQANFYIDTQGWEYEGDGLCAGGNPTAVEMMGTLLVFLSHAAEHCGYYDMRGREYDDPPMFPAHVMEWAYMNKEEIEMIQSELEEQV